MNISSMYVKRGLAHLFSNTSKSTKKIDTLDKKIQAATPCSRYCSSRWSFLFLLSSFVVNVAAPHSEKAFCSKLNPDVCDSTLWALLMSFIWATAICPCHYFCCFRITLQYIVNTEFLENGSTTIEKIRKKNIFGNDICHAFIECAFAIHCLYLPALKIYCFEARDKKISLPVDRPTGLPWKSTLFWEMRWVVKSVIIRLFLAPFYQFFLKRLSSLSDFPSCLLSSYLLLKGSIRNRL